MFLDRVPGETRGLVENAWRYVLSHTHQRGEVFTIHLHPERIALCADDLSAVLAEARALIVSAWFARLDQISGWWPHRATATVGREVEDGG
jgi:hypothetical protein